MKLSSSWSLVSVLLSSLTIVEGSSSSFLRDVVKQGRSGGPSAKKKEQLLNDELLAKAVPLDEYRAQLKAQGLHLPMDEEARRLENNNNNGNVKYYYYSSNGGDAQVQYYNKYQDDNDDHANDDDYYVNEYNYIDFDGYSLKYAKCQPVQRFSEEAVYAGEYSPMVVNDIVIMRLCPSYYCSSSRDYGCLYDYAEYAMDMNDYVRIMLRYKMDKEEQLCDWCENCVAGAERRRRTANYYYYNDDANYAAQYNNGDDGYYGQAAGDDAAQQVDDYYNNYYAGDDAAQQQVDDYNYNAGDDANGNGDDSYAGDDAVQYPEGCEDYESYCLDEYGYSVCDEENNADGGEDGEASMTAEEYLDMIGCVEIDGGYFVRPRCDGYTDQISLGVYNDQFCTWYAGDQVDIENFGLGVDQSVFPEFSGTGCLDCSQSDEPPYFNSNSNLCNRVDVTSSRCTLSLGSELFANNDTNATTYDDENECAYIESLRVGTYDAEGQLYSDSAAGVGRKVTRTQKWLLSLTLLVCVVLAVYSCYLHHAITNLLIKSLSHTDLLPPSRHRRRSSSASRRKGRRSRKPVTEDDDDAEDFEMKAEATPA